MYTLGARPASQHSYIHLGVYVYIDNAVPVVSPRRYDAVTNGFANVIELSPCVARELNHSLALGHAAQDHASPRTDDRNSYLKIRESSAL